LQIKNSMILFYVLILGSGCQPAANGTELPVNDPSGQTIEPTLQNQENIQMTPSIPVPADPRIQGLIDTAMNDLAQRLAVAVDEIILVQAASVIWPDGSLGCPQEGMQYAQVLTPGYLIRLQSEGLVFEYHASKGTTVIYCENPSPPVEGTPGNV
jgi:hypothetical protein